MAEMFEQDISCSGRGWKRGSAISFHLGIVVLSPGPASSAFGCVKRLTWRCSFQAFAGGCCQPLWRPPRCCNSRWVSFSKCHGHGLRLFKVLARDSLGVCWGRVLCFPPVNGVDLLSALTTQSRARVMRHCLENDSDKLFYFPTAKE